MNRWLAGHFFWPLSERMLGRDTMRRFRHLKRNDRCSPEELRDIQDRKLRRLLTSAADHCPFYARRFRDAGLDVSDSRISISDLAMLPTITKDDVRENLDSMTWTACPGGVRSYNTGGSTGRPLRFYIDNLRAAADAAARLRARTWWHVRPGDPEVLLWGAPTELRTDDGIRRSRDVLLNQHILSAFNMTRQTLDEYIDVIRGLRPACLYGYASSLALLARHAIHAGLGRGDLGSNRLRAVFVTGEVLLDRDRDAIAEAFGAPVVIEYGSRDGGMIAMSCEAGSLHVAQDNLVIELLDEQGRAVGPGDMGEVVLTHLEAVGMPLIRYRTGDEARQPAAPHACCACGRHLQRFVEIRGRVTDHIVCRVAGQLRRMHALSLMYVLREAEGLTQFRIVQPSLDRIEVEVVVNDHFTSQVERDVENRLRQRLGDNMIIEIRRQDRIPPTASGKHACVVSHVPADTATEA
jgi:phenylacetate-CoA ligase